MNKTGIYKIVNKINGKIYIGSTTKSFSYRFGLHKSDLRKGTHHSSHLQKAWDKYGEEAFEFIIIEECDKENCIIREQYYLDLYKSYLRTIGYNIALNAQSRLGIKMTEDQINRKYRNIHCFSLEGKLIKVYPTIREIANEGFSVADVTMVLTGLRKSHKKRLWSLSLKVNKYQRNNVGRPYPHSELTKSKMSSLKLGKPRNDMTIPIIQLNQDRPIKAWPSTTKAANSLGISLTNITANLKNKRPSAGGFQFKYF